MERLKLFFIFSFVLICCSAFTLKAKTAPSSLEIALGLGASSVVNSDVVINQGNEQNRGITQDDYNRVGENMFRVQQALNSKYTLADNISLGLFVLRFLADLGDYVVPHEDIMALIAEGERLLGEPLDPDFVSIMNQIEKIRFGERKGEKYVKIYTKDPKGIIYDINEPGDGALKEIKHFELKNEARIFFKDIKSKKEKKWLRRFVSRKVRFFFIAVSALNQIFEPIRSNIKEYIRSVKPVDPLSLRFEGLYIKVVTSTILGTINFKMKKAVAMPGMSDGKELLPPLVAEIRSGLVRVKVSIDQ